MESAVTELPRDIQLSARPRGSGLEARCLLGEPGVLSLCGEVDASTAEELRQCLHVLAMNSSSTVAVDLTGVSFISCAGLAPLAEARGRLGRRLHLRAVSPAADRLLRLTHLSAYFGLRAPPGAARH